VRYASNPQLTVAFRRLRLFISGRQVGGYIWAPYAYMIFLWTGDLHCILDKPVGGIRLDEVVLALDKSCIWSFVRAWRLLDGCELWAGCDLGRVVFARLVYGLLFASPRQLMSDAWSQ
jgi:hypothetical protein